MGKKGKSKSKKASKKSSVVESVKPLNNFYNGTDAFNLPNGDTYVGEYGAHRNGMIWREGRGSYYTQDGHTYEGLWRDDKLIDLTPIVITYPNGDRFEGVLNKNKYERGGEVIFQDGLRLSANFQANKPVGTVHMIDTMGQLWKSVPESNDGPTPNTKTSKIFCRQEQTFFNNIHPLRGVRKEKLKEIEPEWAPERMSYSSSIDEASGNSFYLTDEDLEMLIFGKKPKIDTNMDWEDSPWYQHFAKFKVKRETILSKLEHKQKLTDDEYKWYCRYAIARKNRRVQLKVGPADKKAAPVDATLLKQFHSETHKQSAKPYATFYPTYYWHTQQDQREFEESMEEYAPSIGETMEETIEEEPCEESVGKEIEEEMVTPNPSIACGTSSLFDFVNTATGARLINPCKSIF